MGIIQFWVADMPEQMNWGDLMSQRRFRGPTKDPLADTDPDRGTFSKDADRVIYSSAFRRLSDKTQVEPFPKSDYTRTRLTHSLEASSVGRSLGVKVGRYILKKYKRDLPESDTADGAVLTAGHFGVVVETACLAHDIGNPPFGHAGEDAIRHWFTHEEGKELLDRRDTLTNGETADLQMFEGNAQGFRLLSRLQGWREDGGLQLSCATLGAFTKYPHGSWAVDGTSGEKKARQKFGYFQHDREAFATVASDLGLLKRSDEDGAWCRHPMAYLTEAADDICYNIVDVEDAFKANRLTFKEAEELLQPIAKGQLNRYHLLTENDDKISYLRAKAIGVLVDQVAKAFWENDEEIYRGIFKGELLDLVPFSVAIQQIKVTSREKIYVDDEKLENEAAGYEVIRGLLKIFADTLDDWQRTDGNLEKMSPRYRRTIQLLPRFERMPTSTYQWLLRITDYVSGMTDSYAVRQYRKLMGISVGLDRL